MDEQLEKYLTEMLTQSPDWVKKIETFAKENNIPIMEPLGIDFLMQIVRMKRPGKILEIGTAIGYSALRMQEAYPESQIVSIERDEVRYKEAIANISSLKKEDNIKVIFGDALDKVEEIRKNGPYDLLFIDAAKGQYQRFFEIYSRFLTDNGTIVSDNVLFKGIVASKNEENKRLNKIAGKIRHYNDWLVGHPDYHTSILPIGDGVAVSVKR
ncbi:O-methyltransferase [Sediminibacillus massiliensis]|uniref:O-methyltransferase n=1 Tax=Sediminibacillus massiliensis TaxID=1926277 RepID=UPI001FE6B94D|nr:O-methyltransferase [Sediminibacillus massiliensis]